jgi:hypothetical protein
MRSQIIQLASFVETRTQLASMAGLEQLKKYRFPLWKKGETDL